MLKSYQNDIHGAKNQTSYFMASLFEWLVQNQYSDLKNSNEQTVANERSLQNAVQEH